MAQDKSKIVFIQKNGIKPEEKRLDDAIATGVINKGDLVIIESGSLVYIDLNDIKHVISFKDVVEKFDDISSVDLSNVDIGDTVLIKDVGGIYVPYICQNKDDGTKEVSEIAMGHLPNDFYNLLAQITTNKNDISDLLTRLTADETQMTTNKDGITTINGKLLTDEANIETNASNISTLQSDLTSLSAKVMQSDYNQNDSTKMDYIKNRTHYVDGNDVVHPLDNKYLSDDVTIKNSVTVGTRVDTATVGEKSISGGYQNTVSGQYASALGYKNEAKANSAFTAGYGNKANSLYATSVGRQNESLGRSSFASGEGNKANGEQSTALGKETIAQGLYATSTGYKTKAIGNGSLASGIGTVANGTSQFVFGKYNVADSTSVEIVGGGNSDTARKNLRELDSSGNEKLAGKLTMGDVDPTDNNDATRKKYVDDEVAKKSITIDSDTTTSGYLKSYTVKQNGTTVGIIDIPKDMVIESGSIVTNPTGQPAGKYIQLVLNNDDHTKIYINVADLVDVYTAKENAPIVQLTISDANEISATIKDGSVGLDKLTTSVQMSLGKADSAIQTITTGNSGGSINVDGSDISVKGFGYLPSLKTSEKTNLVDAINELKDTGGYVLPVANSGAIGGVKASTADNTYTEEVKIKADQRLYVKPFNQNDVAVKITKETTPDTGYGTTYSFKQGNDDIGKVQIPKELTTQASAAQVQLAISSDKEISGSLVDGSVEKAKLVTSVQTTLNQVDTNKTNIGTLSSLTTSNKTSLVGAVNSLKSDLDTAKTDLAVTMEETAGTGDILKTYTFKRGASTIGTINLAKDIVVQSGAIEVNPTGQPAGTYLVLTLNDTAGSKIYINVADLASTYTALDTVQIDMDISATNQISATLKAGCVGNTELANNAVTTSKIADSNVTLDKLATTVQTSIGKADTAVQTITTGTANGTIKVDGSDVTVKGLGSAAYTDSTAYDAKDSAKNVKTELLGASTDAVTAITINGVKNYVTNLNNDMDDRVSALEAGGGGGGGDIQTAINALNVADTPVAGKYVSGVSETKGKISVTREDFPNMSGSMTPTGSVTSTFTGTNVAYTPEGIISTPVITNTNTTSPITGIDSVGTLASCTMPTLNTTYDSTAELVKIDWNAGAYTDGTLPTKAVAVNAVTSVSSTSSQPTFTGTQSNIKATGTVTSAFTGTASAVTVSV